MHAVAFNAVAKAFAVREKRTGNAGRKETQDFVIVGANHSIESGLDALIAFSGYEGRYDCWVRYLRSALGANYRRSGRGRYRTRLYNKVRMRGQGVNCLIISVHIYKNGSLTYHLGILPIIWGEGRK